MHLDDDYKLRWLLHRAEITNLITTMVMNEETEDVEWKVSTTQVRKKIK